MRIGQLEKSSTNALEENQDAEIEPIITTVKESAHKVVEGDVPMPKAPR